MFAFGVKPIVSPKVQGVLRPAQKRVYQSAVRHRSEDAEAHLGEDTPISAKYLWSLEERSYLLPSPKHRPFVPWCIPRTTQPGTEVWIPHSQRQNRRVESRSRNRKAQQRRAGGSCCDKPVHRCCRRCSVYLALNKRPANRTSGYNEEKFKRGDRA